VKDKLKKQTEYITKHSLRNHLSLLTSGNNSFTS